MNDFDVSNVTSKFETQLSGSTKLEQVKNALIDNSDKRYNPRIGKDANDGKYNPVNDKKISVPNYIDWLSKDHSKDIPKQEQPTTPSKIKEGYKKKFKVTNPMQIKEIQLKAFESKKRNNSFGTSKNEKVIELIKSLHTYKLWDNLDKKIRLVRLKNELIGRILYVSVEYMNDYFKDYNDKNLSAFPGRWQAPQA